MMIYHDEPMDFQVVRDPPASNFLRSNEAVGIAHGGEDQAPEKLGEVGCLVLESMGFYGKFPSRKPPGFMGKSWENRWNLGLPVKIFPTNPLDGWLKMEKTNSFSPSKIQ